VAVGALAHELLAVRRLLDLLEEQREPAVRGKLLGQRGRIGLGLERPRSCRSW
jgi:hypothetical protein